MIAGPSGVGKSTVGKAVAARRGVRLVDLDAVVGDAAALFAAEGEAGFRVRERRAMEAIADDDDVVLALGGGSVAVGGSLFQAWQRVVLMAGVDTLLRRVEGGPARPMLARDRRERVAALLAARTPGWRAFGPWVHTDALDVDAVTRRVEALL